MRLLTTFTLLTICLTAIGQTSPTKKERWVRVDSLFTKDGKKQKAHTRYSYVHIDTEFKYSDSTGKGVIIQNSLPKGGRYTMIAQVRLITLLKTLRVFSTNIYLKLLQKGTTYLETLGK